MTLHRDPMLQHRKLTEAHMTKLATLLGCSLDTLLCLLRVETDLDFVFDLFQKSQKWHHEVKSENGQEGSTHDATGVRHQTNC